ncbi:hypothetical protein Tco_1405535 [Tanacetum coccineum]
MDPYVTSTPNSTKLPILDTEFGDSYRAPAQDKSVSGEATPSSRSKGRIVAVTTEDIQKRRNDVKARTTLLLALPDEHQTFGGNEATKKTKKNLLKQQYGNFKAEGSETLEQTFNRLQAIVSQLEFLDVPVEQEDLNQKFLTSLSPEWLMHTIVWRNRNDLDTISLDDLYNHLKVYESEVQKKGGSSSQNMAFISSSNTNSGKSEVPTAQSFSTASGQVTTVSTEVATATFSHDTICAYIATQQSGSQIKYEDITQIDDDDIEEMDIKWNMALLSMRADRSWKKTSKKITIQGSDVAGFDKSTVKFFNCHKLGHFAREKNTENLTTKISKLREELFDSESDLCNYKRGLSQVEARVIPPPPAQVYSSPMLDLSWTGLPEFADNTVTNYTRPTPSVDVTMKLPSIGYTAR